MRSKDHLMAMTRQFLKTPMAARVVGAPHSHLHSLIRRGRIAPPTKDSSGDYVWTDTDLENARRAIEEDRASRQRKSASP